MSTNHRTSPPPPRAARLAEALRANLKRRKAAARGKPPEHERQPAQPEPATTASAPADPTRRDPDSA